MRNRLAALSALLLCGALCAAEKSAWTALAAPADAAGLTLYGVAFADAKMGWAVGEKGTCLHSADGGKTWTAQKTGSAAVLRCVRFKDAQHGWACGDGDPAAPQPIGHVVRPRALTSGTLLTTADGGKTWQTGWVNTNFDVTCVEISAAPTLQVGINGGVNHMDGDIHRSGDNGKSWNGYRCYRALFDIRAADAKNWLAVGSPVCVGFMPTPTEPTYTNKQCRALFSRDGGVTWAVSKGSEGAGRSCLRGLAAGAKNAVAVGDGGAILRSTDHGENWTAVQSGAKEDLLAVACQGALFVAVGKSGTVLVSADEGQTWKAKPSGGASLTAVCAAGEGFVAVGEKGAILHATAKALTE